MLTLAIQVAAIAAQVDRSLGEGNRFQERRLFPEADSIYSQAIAAARVLGDTWHLLAVGYNNRGALRYRAGEFQAAGEDYDTAVAVWERLDRPKDLAALLSNRAELEHARGRDAEALAYVERAIEIQRRSDTRTVATEAIYANILRSLGRYRDSLDAYDRAAALARDRAQTAFVLSSKTDLLLAMGLLDEAAAGADRAVEAALTAHGHEDARYGNAIHQRARVARAQGDLPQTERFLRQSLAVFERALPESHPRLVSVLAELAGVLSERARHSEANRLFLRAERVAQAALGEGHPDFAALQLTGGDLARARQDLDEAERRFRLALALAEKSIGRNQARFASYPNSLGAILMDRQNPREAEAAFRQSVELRDRLLGPMNHGNAEPLLNLAAAQFELGRYAEARLTVERSLAIRQQAYGDSHPTLIPALRAYANVLEKMGERKRAKELHARAGMLSLDRPEARHTVDWKTLRTFR